MIDLFITILIVSMWCNGLKIATMDGMIFEKVEKWLDSKLIKDDKAHFIYYPLLYCINCMASFHGAIIYMVLNGIGLDMAYELPIVIVCCTWLNGVLYNFDA